MHAIKLLGSAALLLGLSAFPTSSNAAPSAGESVTLAPVTTVGGVPNTSLQKLEALIEEGISALPKTKAISAKTATQATRKAKKPKLRSCDGNAACLTELGKLTGAAIVVYAEVSDLGDAQVIYLKAVDVGTGKELRSTTLELGAKTNRKKASKAAAAQLLAPQTYVGTLSVKTPVQGATVFLDGHKISASPGGAPVQVYVGSHALRVTHPEHRDFVRFVDVVFEELTVVDAELLGLPGVDRKLSAEGVLGNGSNPASLIIRHRDTPWYHRWYTITGGVAAIAITSAVIVSGGDSFNADLIRDL